MKQTTALISAILALAPLLTLAQPTNWAVEAGGNGHYYEAIWVAGGITWSDASVTASNRGGYLATITSSNENAFVFGLVSQDTNFWYHSLANNWWGPWLGGLQPAGSPEPDGGWQWVTGETFTYSNWSPGQPSNNNPTWNGGENRIQFGGQTNIASTWNDLNVTNKVSARSFIVEYAGPLPSSLIDFETLPSGAMPAEGMAISNQFFASHGVSFAFTNGTFPVLAKRRGTNIIAFEGPTGLNTLAANQAVGDYFLTDPHDAEGLPPAPLIISYRQTVSNASGVIIDIDGAASHGGNEAWLLEARGTNGVLLATNRLTVASPNAGDGLATPWSFRGVPGIGAIYVIYDGQKTNGLGLAFDNFSPALAVTPPSLTVTVTQRVARIGVAGSFNGSYRVEWATSIPSSHWQVLTNLDLTNAPQQFILDYGASNATRCFYRAIGF